MRDIINATIGTDHFLKCSTYALARNGEGLTPCLSITIPDGLLDYWAYIDFKKPNGETFKTPRIDVDEGKIIYNIPCGVLDTEGKLEVQVVFQNADNEIWKTYVKEFAVRYSINATDDIPDKQDFITEAQKTLDEAMAIATNVEKRANAGEFNGKDAITDQSYNPESSNAQSGIAVAEALSNFDGGLKEYELLCDTTITEDVASVKWTTTDNGEPISNYKDFFIYFLGKFTAEEIKAIWCKSGAQYFMWKTFTKKTSVRGFWISIEQIFSTDEIDSFPNTSSVNGTAIFISKYPKEWLSNVTEGQLNSQGLSDNNQDLRCDTTIAGRTDLPIKELEIGQVGDAMFASGSRFLLLGRKA